MTAAGQAPLSNPWRKNGVPVSNGGRIAGAKTDELTISATIPADSDDYDVVVTDGVGQSLVSTEAALLVSATPAAPVITATKSVTVASTSNAASVVSQTGSAWSRTLNGGTITGGPGHEPNCLRRRRAGNDDLGT